MSGAGFHSPAKYGKNDRISKKELEEMAEEQLEDEMELTEIEKIREGLYVIRDRFLANGDAEGQRVVYALLEETTDLERKYCDYE